MLRIRLVFTTPLLRSNLLRSKYIALAAMLSLAACGGGGAAGSERSLSVGTPPTQSPPTVITFPAQSATPIPPPASGVYLGALVNPDDDSSTEAQQTRAFEGQIGRKLALHIHYEDWNATDPNPLSKIANDPGITDDLSAGRVPVLSWRCGASMIDIANGVDDATVVVPAAQAVAALRRPVFLRWFWEFNLNFNGGSRNNDSPACFNGTVAESQQQQFINAWEHIRSVFLTNGATNVTWLWCPDGAPLLNNMNTLETYLPPHYDWIGLDSYDKSDAGFSTTLSKFYATFSKYPKPMMFAETAEETNASPYTQADFFTEAASALPSSFPKVRAFMIFDQAGNAPNDWILSPGGLNAFKQIAGSPYFAPRVP